MAVTFDAVGPSAAGQAATGASSITWSHTCSGSSRLLIASAAFGVSGNPGYTATATCNGVAMTSVARINSNNSSTDGWVQIWSTVNAADQNTLVLTLSAGQADISSGSVSLNGVNQTTPLGTPVTGYGDTTTMPNIVVPATTVGNMLVDTICDGNVNGIASSIRTSRWIRNINGNTAAGNGACSTADAVGGTMSMGYNVVDDWWGMIGVEVIAADAGSDQVHVPINTYQPI